MMQRTRHTWLWILALTFTSCVNFCKMGRKSSPPVIILRDMWTNITFSTVPSLQQTHNASFSFLWRQEHLIYRVSHSQSPCMQRARLCGEKTPSHNSLYLNTRALVGVRVRKSGVGYLCCCSFHGLEVKKCFLNPVIMVHINTSLEHKLNKSGKCYFLWLPFLASQSTLVNYLKSLLLKKSFDWV